MLLSSDRGLLQRFRAGDRDALGAVYDEYAPAVAAFLARGFSFSSKERVLRFCGYQQPFDLDNALHETMARAFAERARLAYDGLSPYKNYLLAIARNFVISELRRREVAMSQLVHAEDGAGIDAQQELPDETDAAVAAATPARSAEAEYLHRELRRLYEGFVAQLTAQERAFFGARFEEQLTQVEAGKRAGLSHMQARTREKDLRRRFLKYMHAHGYLDGYPGKAAVVPS
jgi:RNA polymerase sigma factor (sigma-70 family)